LEQCAAGRPRTVLITGDAGLGKSSLVDELVSRADTFSTLSAESFPSGVAAPYDTLLQLGVDMSLAASAGASSSALAAQRLRSVVDEHLASGPVLIIVDDLQWADPESVEALLALMRRTEAEPLLLCVATRPLPADRHAMFQRWAARPRRVDRIALTGLDLAAAGELLRTVRPEMPEAVVATLWEHTGGNPLYLQALADEYDGAELLGMRVLPAPAEFAETVTARVARLPKAAQALARATAVLGEAWGSLLDAAAVGEVADAGAAADDLVTARLATVRNSGTGEQIRLVHALVRGAVYGDVPLRDRRTLHARAAGVVTGVAAVFEHRLAAAVSHDGGLADDLHAYARDLRERRDYRSAAHFERLASTVTADPRTREGRWLDSLFDSLMGGDRAVARAETDAIAQAADVRRRDLALGFLAVMERRLHEAVRILAPRSGLAEGAADDVVQYRIEGLLAWARLQADAPEPQIRLALDRAAALTATDGGMGRLAMIAAGQLAIRHSDDPATAAIPGLPDDPASTPVAATGALAWRGAFYAAAGLFTSAVADLSEVTDRMQRGQIEFSAGAFHAVLGRAQWFAGDWARARISFNAAAGLGAEDEHPVVLTSLPLPAIGDGDLAAADRLLAAARTLLQRVPWREIVDQFTVVEVIRAHAEGQAPAHLVDGLRTSLDELSAGRLTKSALWSAHVGLAAVWGSQPATARELADRVERARSGAAWAPGLAEWIRGLAAEVDGDGRSAVRHLRNATRADLAAVPLYRAHVHVDHARLAHLMQGPAAARPSLDVAVGGYRSLGATAYLERARALQSDTAGPAATGRPAPAGSVEPGPVQLSDRERDVLTLVVAGLTYAQIAQDLFITQSTVSFHLGNIYAKTNVRSRHELAQLARADPAVLGLADPVPAPA
jgi:DNA-binding CsgD family transcriptional regulator